MLVNWITPGSQVYIHTELPWVPKGSQTPTNVDLTGPATWNWLLSRATTPQEKAEVEQEKAYDQSHPDNLQAFGDGVGANTLLGWAMIGVDPFAPYGPDGGLQQAIRTIEDGGSGASAVGKSAKEEAKKAQQQSPLLDQVSSSPDVRSENPLHASNPADGSEPGKPSVRAAGMNPWDQRDPAKSSGTLFSSLG